MSEFEQKKHDISVRIVERIVSDPKFRASIVENAPQALVDAGFEQDFKELHALASSSEVSGYAHALFTDSWGCVKL